MKATEQYFPVILFIKLNKMALIWNVTIQTKATEQYFPMILFITLYKVALTFESEDEILSVTIQMKATKP